MGGSPSLTMRCFRVELEKQMEGGKTKGSISCKGRNVSLFPVIHIGCCADLDFLWNTYCNKAAAIRGCACGYDTDVLRI